MPINLHSYLSSLQLLILTWIGSAELATASPTLPQERVLPGGEGVGSPYGYFGQQVALDGNRMMVVAKEAAAVGSVIYYEFEAGSWLEKQQLLATGNSTDVQFGSDLFLHGDTLVVGASSIYRERDNNSIYIYGYNDFKWQLEQKITGFSLVADRMGAHVALDQDTLFFAAEDCEFDFLTVDCVVEFVRSDQSWVEGQIIKPEFDFYYSGFGQKLLIKGHELYIGAPRARNGVDHNVGGVFHFLKTAGDWVNNQVLFASDGLSYDEFSTAINVYENTLVIGAYSHDTAVLNQGAVYIFNRETNTSQWQETDKLMPALDENAHHFGYSISLYEDQLLIGLESGDQIDELNDKFYLFENQAGNWTPIIFDNPFAGRNGRFAHSVAISDVHLVVSEIMAGDNMTGVFHSYEKTANAWQHASQVEPELGSDYAKFGNYMTADGDFLFISAPKEFNSNNQYGSVYIYSKTLGDHQMIDKVISPDTNTTSDFGYAIDVSLGRLAISSPYDQEAGDLAGAVFIYDEQTAWQTYQKLIPMSQDSTARFGTSVSIDGDSLAVGAPFELINDLYVGNVSIFEITDDVWTHELTIEPNEVLASDRFGQTVVLVGEHLMISSKTNNDIAGNTGEVDIYRKINGVWTYLQSFTDANLNYRDIGNQVIIKGDLAAISATSIAANAGAVFMLQFNGTSWDYLQVLYADDFTSNNLFGSAIEITPKSIYIGASNDRAFGYATGSIYQFNRLANTWQQSQKINSFDQLNGIGFGANLTLIGSELCIGAPLENTRGFQAGAVYCQEIDEIFTTTFE